MRSITKIKQLAKKIELLTGDEFYTAQAELVKTMREYMNQNRDYALKLSKNDLLFFISLVSSHRPIEPVWLLVDISNQVKGVNT